MSSRLDALSSREKMLLQENERLRKVLKACWRASKNTPSAEAVTALAIEGLSSPPQKSPDKPRPPKT